MDTARNTPHLVARFLRAAALELRRSTEARDGSASMRRRRANAIDVVEESASALEQLVAETDPDTAQDGQEATRV